MIVVLALAACVRALPGPDEAAPPQAFDARCLHDGDGPCAASGALPTTRSSLRVGFEGACPRVLVAFQGTQPLATEVVYARVRARAPAMDAEHDREGTTTAPGEALRRGGPPPPHEARETAHPEVALFPWPEGLERGRVRWGCDDEEVAHLDADRLVTLEVGRRIAEGEDLVMTLPGPSPTAFLVAQELRDRAQPSPQHGPLDTAPPPRGAPIAPPPSARAP